MKFFYLRALREGEVVLTLSFLSLFFVGKEQLRNTTKKEGFYMPTEPLKSLEKTAKKKVYTTTVESLLFSFSRSGKHHSLFAL